MPGGTKRAAYGDRLSGFHSYGQNATSSSRMMSTSTRRTVCIHSLFVAFVNRVVCTKPQSFFFLVPVMKHLVVPHGGVANVHPCAHPVSIPDRQQKHPANSLSTPYTRSVHRKGRGTLVLTYPKPAHAKRANSVSVAVTPIVLMSGNITAVTSAMISARNALQGKANDEVSRKNYSRMWTRAM